MNSFIARRGWKEVRYDALIKKNGFFVRNFSDFKSFGEGGEASFITFLGGEFCVTSFQMYLYRISNRTKTARNGVLGPEPACII